jgi:hypothetical protein
MTTPKLILLLLLTSLLSVHAAEDTPEATVKAYFAALSKGDRTNANRLTARFPKFGDAQVAAVTDRYIELHKRPGYAPSIRNGKAVEDCAVVVILESPTDPDPAYLIKQDGAWRVLPKLTQYNRDYFEFPETTLARFRELEKWFNAQVGK